MSYDAGKGNKNLQVQFVPDEDVLEHITDKPEGVRLRNTTTAQRISNMKSLTKNVIEHDAADETLEIWKEKDYVDVLGTDAGDILHDGPGTGGGDVYSFQTVKRSNKMAQLASEMARTPGKTVTFSTTDSLEEAVSPPTNGKKQSTNKTPSKGKKPEFISTTPHRLRKRLSEMLALLQQKPCIWDLSSPDYNNKNKKDAAWEEIAAELHEERWARARHNDRTKMLAELALKFKSCKDAFRRALHEEKRKSGSGAPKKRQYIYFKEMQFLRRVVEVQPHEDSLEEVRSAEVQNMPEVENPGSILQGPSPLKPDVMAERSEEDLPGPSATSDIRAQPVNLSRKRTKRRHQVLQDPISAQIDRGILSYLAQPAPEPSPAMDEEAVFCTYLAKKLREVPPELKFEAKMSMATTIEAFSPPFRHQMITQTLDQWCSLKRQASAGHMEPGFSTSGIPLTSGHQPPHVQPMEYSWHGSQGTSSQSVHRPEHMSQGYMSETGHSYTD